MLRSFFVLLILCLSVLSVFTPQVALADSDTMYPDTDDATIYSWAAAYADARNPTTFGSVAVTSSVSSLRIGQDYDTVYPITYTVWRSVLYFDTSNLGFDDVDITGVTLSLWAKEINTPNPDYKIEVGAASVSQPPLATEFNSFGGVTYNLNNELSASFSTAAYVDIELNPSGYGLINLDGITTLGLRSSEDQLSSVPTVAEYCDFWSAESNHPPKLTVTYDILALGTPGILNVSNVAVFGYYIEPGDQLYVFASNVRYAVTPSKPPGEYFLVQLKNESGIIVAQTLVKRWNYSPLSIYLSADYCDTWDVHWGGLQSLVIIGNSNKFVTPLESTYALNEDSYKGTAVNSDIFRQWIYVVSDRMGIEDGITAAGYRDDTDSSLLNEEATAIFTEGIPLINSLYPDRFVEIGLSPSQGETTIDDTYSGTLYGTWGTYWTGALDDVGSGFGIPGYWIVSLGFAIASIIVVALLSRQIASPLIYLAPVPIMILGFLLGVPLWIATIACVMCIAYFSLNVFARGLN